MKKRITLQQHSIIKTTSNNSPLVPVISLSLFAIASGFMMSLIPLALEEREISVNLASWLASVFYAGLLGGTLISAKIIRKTGHNKALITFLFTITLTVALMALFSNANLWLASRFVAGIAVAGVFVVIESWLLMANTEKARAKRLGLYMASLYGGSALGQLGISVFGTSGVFPLIVIVGLMSAATLPPILCRNEQPQSLEHSSIKIKEVQSIPSSAYIGCIVSGLILAAIYGLLPLELGRKYNHEQVGSLMAIVILGGMLIQPLVSWLNSRIEKVLLMAIFCFVGLLSIAMIEIATVTTGMVAGLFMLGAAAFALYPVAITLACQNLCASKIVSVAELMLLSYSFGSVLGPIIANFSMLKTTSLPLYFGICFAVTLFYMLVSITRNRRQKANNINDSISIDI